MLLSPDDVKLFYKLHGSLMYFANLRLGVVPDIVSAAEFANLGPQPRLEIRRAVLDNLELIESFVDENPANLSADEKDIVLSWRQQVFGRFYAFRQLKKYMVFLSSTDPPIAYGVVALVDPFELVIGPQLPVFAETVLLPFRDKIIYDGLLNRYNITFGGGIKRRLNDSYREAKERLGIVTSLPIETVAASATPTTKRRKPKKATSSGPKNVKPVLEAIISLTDEFCREQLNEEYAELCRKLAEKLSRKRPSPLLRGKPQTWACGIIRVIGWVNFLDDRTLHPHMKLTEIDEALGVSKSTGQAKSLEIRKMLKIYQLDVDWTLPSRMDDNPRVWMVEVNGFIIDLRFQPREVQEVAFERGLIPYIPGEREIKSVQDDDEPGADASSGQLYQFKITLNDANPAIWRRIQVEDCTLDKLHEHIQTAMGWTNSHLHQFQIDGQYYGDPEVLDDGFMGFECVDSKVTKLSDVVPNDGGGFVFRYEYDFGDDWQHQVLFEGCPQAEPGQPFPLCLEGQRACPPEDVGGMGGYAEYLAALADPNHEQHDELIEWSGPFDPEKFDAAEATERMRQGRPAWP